jgi:acyl-CoA:acyl-CoA alkyltransferase
MLYSKVCIDSYGYLLPEKVLTSKEIEEQLTPIYNAIGCPKGRLEQLTGVRERRIWEPGTLPSTIASQAAKKCLQNSQHSSEDIDLVIHTGVCRDALEPATAQVVHHNLNLSSNCMAFDISNACLGFLNGILVASNMIELGQIKTALIVTGENSGPLYHKTIPFLLKNKNEQTFRDSLASLTLGSASTAMLLTHEKHSNTTHRVLGGFSQTDSSGYDLCTGDGNIHALTMKTKASELMKKGLTLSKTTWELFKRRLDWNNESISHFITHQISQQHHIKGFELLNIPIKKGYSYLENLGNTGSAAAPLSLMLTAEKELIKLNDRIATIGIGSGLSTLMLGLSW